MRASKAVSWVSRRRFLTCGGGVMASAAVLNFAAPEVFPASEPKRGGFSPSRLKATSAAMQGLVARGEAAGMVTALYRHGALAYWEAFGWQDREAGIRMRPDAIFRIASMTKPLIAAATLTLVDEGALALNDPVEKFLPELANRQVLQDPGGSLDATTPATRPMRLVDLLTHHSGLTMGIPAKANPESPQAKWPLTHAMIEADKARSAGPDAWLKELARLPLAYEPGTQFNYGISFDLLGVLLARASGMSLPDFMRTRLFEPLGMKDTAFQVPTEKHEWRHAYRRAIFHLSRWTRGARIAAC